MSELPAPLVPADCDLRDFLFTPVEFQRLFSSETWLMCNDAEKVAALMLWGNSWSQLPAGSMPKDERLLAHLSGAGPKWKRVKAMAMRGWILCSDDRYYHPVMCEKALEAWLEKLAQRLSSGAGNAKRWGTDFDPEPIIAEIYHSRELLAELNPKSRALEKKPPKAPEKNPAKSPDGTSNGSPDVIPTGSQETGTGTGTGNLNNSLSGARDDRHDIDGLSDYHREDWQPDTQRLGAYLTRAGIPMPDQAALANSLTRFNLHNRGKALTEGQTYSKFVTWLTGDHRNAQTQQRTQGSGATPAGNTQPARKLTPAEQIEHDCRQLQQQSGAGG